MIEDKAKELGRLIGQGSEYKEVKRSSDALNDDPETVALLQKMERLRVTAQLTDVATGFQLWSDRYDRDAADGCRPRRRSRRSRRISASSPRRRTSIKSWAA